MMVEEYEMVEAGNPKELTIKVNEFLQRGWRLHGSSSVAACEHGVSFVQPVVRTNHANGVYADDL